MSWIGVANAKKSGIMKRVQVHMEGQTPRLFSCDVCGRLVPAKNVIRVDNKALCEECYNRLYLEKDRSARSMPHTGKGERLAQVQRRREDAGVGDTSLARAFINRSVAWELKHIPRGDKGSLQNSLRFSYKILRRKDMALGKSRHETLKELIEEMQQIHPDFTPLYDKKIFAI